VTNDGARPPAQPAMPVAENLLAWAKSFAVGAAHFSAILCVSPFSKSQIEKLLRRWGEKHYACFGVTLEVEDRSQGRLERESCVVVFLNQRSLGEVFAYPQIFSNYRAIINAEFALLPLLGWAWTLAGSIIIVRQWKTHAKRGVERARHYLRRGESIGISIEGRRNVDGRPSEFKKGPIVLAIAEGATIVPMYFVGVQDVFKPNSWRVRPGPIRVVFCEPIPTRDLCYEDRNRLLEQIRQVAERELPQH
jgi:1-acyl-sn-glycerol-3-phosphate acyltransferase